MKARPAIAPNWPRALRLAEAEAQVARTTRAERDHLIDMQSRLVPAKDAAARILAQSSPTRPAALRRTMQTLTRYRRDAESARRRAFKA